MSDNIIRKATTGEPGNPGQFGSHARPGATIALDDADIRVYDYDMSDPIHQLEVAADDEHLYAITARRRVNFLHLAPGVTEDEKRVWLDRNQGPVAEFLRTRYDTAVADASHDWAEQTIEFTVGHDGPADEATAADVVWNSTSVVQFHNEEDNGSSGSENMDRLLQEFVAEHSVVAEGTDMDEARSMDPRAVAEQVFHRAGEREIQDRTAVAIAHQLAQANPGGYPEVRKLAGQGYAHRDRLNEELRRLYEGSYNGAVRDRLNMMFTYNIHGADNS